MNFISLPTGKFYKRPERINLKIFPAVYVGRFYRNLADNLNNFLRCDFQEKIANDTNIPTEDFQKYILATSDFAEGDANGY